MDLPPVASAGGPYAAVEGQPVTLDGGASSDPDGDALTYKWSFGDGSSSTLAATTHKYADNGTYTATLLVKDPYGATATATATVEIANAAPVVKLTAPS